MKKIYIIFLIFLPISLFAQSAKPYGYNADCNYWTIENHYGPVNNITPDIYTWNFVQTNVTAQLTEIFFIDLMKGWATHTGTGSLRTTNGGSNWDSTSFKDSTFTTAYNGIYFISQNTGWAVGGAVQIRKTTNGGLNWIKQYAPPVAGVLNGVYFWNDNTGIVIGRKNAAFNSFIARTTDGGTSWAEIAATVNSNNELHDQYWFDANTGFICGRDVLLKSTNGGLNYTNLYANIPPTSNGANALLSITFVNQQTGWIGGSNLDSKNIYKTTNGGVNWFFQTNPVSQYQFTQINDVKFKSQDTGWAIHGTPFAGAIMITTNGGDNWVIEDNTNIWFDCMSIYQKTKAWVGSGSGRVWYAELILTGIKGINNQVPAGFQLLQNYPNPFNPTTVISFSIGIPSGQLTVNSFTTLKIYDIVGREVETLLNEQLLPGTYEVDFDGSRYPSGVYYYQLKAGSFINTRKMVLVK
ncbi:MAG TPA: T9SS type A sorting domain-containing protein [Ignavibacteria bacterium]|nr:T9SS type A sorting domain-containing protein [Ignavibacteria bacterium]